ncbi:hypothetical protein [Streptomyces sp. NPDC050355]|uniref:hypothetical protein n=1 Tax=Streptomyces sp. NPDC050355 TaxID=3365609 RepID=UPI0037BC984D
MGRPAGYGAQGRGGRVRQLSDLDYAVAALGRPHTLHTTGVSAGDGQAAAETVLRYDDVVVEYTASSMVPASYGVTHGFEATFTEGVLELHERPFESTGPVMHLTEWTASGSREIDLAPADNYTAAIHHVLDRIATGTEDTAARTVR